MSGFITRLQGFVSTALQSEHKANREREHQRRERGGGNGGGGTQQYSRCAPCFRVGRHCPLNRREGVKQRDVKIRSLALRTGCQVGRREEQSANHGDDTSKHSHTCALSASIAEQLMKIVRSAVAASVEPCLRMGFLRGVASAPLHLLGRSACAMHRAPSVPFVCGIARTTLLSPAHRVTSALSLCNTATSLWRCVFALLCGTHGGGEEGERRM